MPIRMFREDDLEAWVRMRGELWPGEGIEEARAWQRRTNAVTLVAEHTPGVLVGFAEAGERTYADGCDSSPVAFLEGWYVNPAHRHKGWGGALVQAVSAWARSRRLTELASDSLLDDDSAIAAHLHIGFQEVERSVKFRINLEAQE